MNPSIVRDELEENITSRRNEIRFLKNQLAYINKEYQKDQYRRALLLMLYAHLEGFFKFSMLSYIRCINDEKICRSDVNCSIAAASFQDAFHDLFSQRNFRVLNTGLAEDAILHEAAKQIEFVNRLHEFYEQDVLIPEGLIDTSNLKPEVLKKCLFLLGFQYDAFKDHDNVLRELLGRRNSIAHGAESKGIEEELYDKLEKSAFKIMENIMTFVVDALKSKSYLRTP